MAARAPQEQGGTLYHLDHYRARRERNERRSSRAALRKTLGSVVGGMAVAAAVGVAAWVALPRAQDLYREWKDVGGVRQQVAQYAELSDGVSGVSLYDVQDLARRAGVSDGRALRDCEDSAPECLGLSRGELEQALRSYRADHVRHRSGSWPDAMSMPDVLPWGFPYRR